MTLKLHRFALGLAGLMGLGLLAGCQSKPKTPPTNADLISNAQKVDVWKDHDALEGLLFVTLGQGPQVEAKFLYDIQNNRIRLTLPDEYKTVIVFDGHQAWVSPANSPLKETRSNFLAWTQLVSIPFRLKAQGVQTLDLPKQKLGSHECLAVKLTLGPGSVGTPADWHIIFADPETKRVEGIAYSQGYGRPADEAESDLRAVTLYDFKPMSEVRIGTEWKFWQFHKTEGIFGLPIGSARLLNLEYVERPSPSLFTRPGNARLDETGK